MKSKTVFILLLLPLCFSLSGCQSTRAAKLEIDKAIAEATARIGQTDDNIIARMEEWWALKQAGDPSVEGVGVVEAAERAGKEEWRRTREALEVIKSEGERRAKEAMSGWGSELAGNVGGAVGAVASGQGWLAALMALLGLGTVGTGAVQIAKGYTKRKALEQQIERDKKYQPGGPFANLAALSAQAEKLVQAVQQPQAMAPQPQVVQQLPPPAPTQPQPYQVPAGYALVPQSVADGVWPSTGRKLPEKPAEDAAPAA